MFIVSLTSRAQFQPGYYISESDTSFGFIKLYKNSDKATFKTSQSSKEIRSLNPKNVSFISINQLGRYSSYFHESLNDAEPFYLRAIIIGETNLFQAVLRNSEIYFIQKRGSEVVLLDREKFRNQLSVFFSDCREVHRDILSPKKVINHNLKDLHDIVIRYNTCLDEENPPKSFLPKNPISFKVGGELNLSNQNFSITEGSTFGRSLDYPSNLGFGFGLLGEIRSKNFSLELGIKYLPRNTTLKSVPLNPNFPQDLTDVSLKLNQLAFPLLVRYYLSVGGIEPFLNAGVQIGMPLGNNIESSAVASSVEIDFSEPEFAYILGGGVRKVIQNGNEVSFSFQYVNGAMPYKILFFSEDDFVGFSPNNGFQENAEVSTEMLLFSIGYIIRIARKKQRS